MPYKIVGISGSPVKNGNVDAFLALIMDLAFEKGLDAETINLSRMEIKDCIHCNFCLAKQKQGKYCSLEDDVQLVFEKSERADEQNSTEINEMFGFQIQIVVRFGEKN